MHAAISSSEIPSYVLRSIKEADLFFAEVSLKDIRKIKKRREATEKERETSTKNRKAKFVQSAVANKHIKNPSNRIKRILNKEDWDTYVQVHQSTDIGKELLKKGRSVESTTPSVASWVFFEHRKNSWKAIYDAVDNNNMHWSQDFLWELDKLWYETPSDAFLDYELKEYAHKHGVPLDFLDTSEDLLDQVDEALIEASLSEKLADCRQVFNEPREVAIIYYNYLKELVKMARHYRKGDDIVDKPKSGLLANLDHLILAERNQLWVKELTQKAAKLKKGKNQIFVTAGAAHFFGKKNVRELLTKRGYIVRRLDSYKR